MPRRRDLRDERYPRFFQPRGPAGLAAKRVNSPEKPPKWQHGTCRMVNAQAMASPRCEDDIVTVVLLGNFNPSIFQPRWMATVGLLGDEEAKSAKISLIAQDTAIFEVGEWLAIHVTTERFQATGPFS